MCGCTSQSRITKLVKTHQHLCIPDSCSQGTFVSNHLLGSLRVTGPSTTIIVKTLSGAKRIVTKAISGVQMKSMENHTKWSYSQQKIEISKEKIATTEKIKRWEYHKIEKQVCQRDDVTI